MDAFLIEKVSLIAVDIVLILLILTIIFANSKSYTNRFYATTALSIFFWVNFGFLVYYFEESANVILSARLNFAAVISFCVFAYFFGLKFPEDEKKRLTVLNIAFLLSGVFLFVLSLFSPTIIKSVKIDGLRRIWEEGSLGWLFYIFVVISAFLFIYNVFRKYKSAEPNNQIRIRSFAYGVLLFVLFNIIFNIVLPTFLNEDRFYWLGDYSVVFFLGFTAYAIVKYGLFNIKVIATQVTVVALSVALLIETFVSNNYTEGAIKAIIWVLATYGGYILIKSVKTEIKQKEELQVLAKKLDEANMHLEELDEEKDNFISMASHELNTPIAAIEGYLSMIIDEKMAGQNIDAKAKKYLDNVYFSSKRLAALVRDLLNVSRIESGRIHLVNEEAQIEDVIERSIAEVKIKADEVGHKLTFEKPKTALPKTWLDVPRITEVMINIIGNAIKYTEPPGIITVRAQAGEGKIVVSVEDNGRGIPKDKEEHVFQKFSQVEVLKDQVKGTGLGMFITKNLIELAGGKVWFKSSTDPKDHGTTFYFSLPIYKEKPADPHEGEGALFQKKPSDVSKPDTSATPAPLPGISGK